VQVSIASVPSFTPGRMEEFALTCTGSKGVQFKVRSKWRHDV